MYKVPDAINADVMTNQQLHTKLERGLEDAEKGNVQDAANAFEKFRKSDIQSRLKGDQY